MIYSVRALVLPWCLSLACGLLAAADVPELPDSGVPVAATEAILPSGAIAHLRIHDLGRTLANLDQLVVSMLPDRAMPAEFQQTLKQPLPILAYLGRQSVGAPIDQALLTRMSGLDVTAPMSLSFYLGAGSVDWVVALPLSDRAAFSALLVNTLRPRSFTTTTVAGLGGWEIVGANPDLPRQMVLLTSASTVFCCSNLSMASRLASPADKHLADDALFATLVPNADVGVVVNTQAIRPFIGMAAKQVAKAYPGLIANMRRAISRDIPAEQMSSINLQIRITTGLSGVEAVLAYVDALGSAAVETLLPALVRTVSSADGGSLSVTLRADGLAVSATAQGDDFDQFVGAPLPLKDIQAAIAAIPGQRMWFAAMGQRAAAKPTRLVADWLDLTVSKLAVSGIESPFMNGLANYHRTYETVPELIDSLPWMVMSASPISAAVPAGLGLGEWMLAMEKQSVPRPDVMVFPKQDPAELADRFAMQADIENRNATRMTTMLTGSVGDNRLADRVFRFHREARPGKAERLVSESAWLSRHGFFGYSQHEFINRRIAYAAIQGPFHFLQLVDGDNPCWLDAPLPTVAPLPNVFGTLLNRVPAQADMISVARVLPALAELVDVGDGLEQALRQEFDVYLLSAEKAINDHVGDIEAINQALLALPIPLLVQSLNIHTAERTLYLGLPGGLRYPRPAIAPVVRELFAGYLAQRDQLGGSVAWRTAGPRQITLGFDQDLRAAALLLKSTGNAVWTKFFANGNPERGLRAALGDPSDGKPIPPGEVIVFNTLWPQSE